ncbi:unnamed protein product [Alopecurus aequalis]
MDPSNGSCSRTRSGLVRGNSRIEVPNKGSCSKTRSGLVRVYNIADSSGGSSSKARSGLVMVNNIVDSNDGSSSRTRSRLVKVNNIMDSSEGSDSKTQSELVGGNIAMDSNDGSCSKTRSGLVRRNIIVDSNDGSCSKTRSGRVRGNIVMDINEDSASKTRSGLVRGNTAMVSNKDSCSRTRSGLARRSPSVKVENKDASVIKGVYDECCEADSSGKNGSNRSNDLVQCKDEPVMKGPDGWWKEEKPGNNGSRNKTDLVQIKDELFSNGQLPDGWRREERPRKNGTKKYYIDPVSGYEFRSLKDVQRYVESGDIKQCSYKPKKRIIHDVCITENQAHTRAPEYTRPGTADKGIQCELLTSEGITLPRVELSSTYTENAMLPEYEGMKPMQRYANEVDPLEHKSVRTVSAQRSSGGKKSVKRKEPNAEVKPKKRKTTTKEKIATPPRGSPWSAAVNVNPEGNTEPGDEPTSVNHVNQVEPIQKGTADESQFSQADTVNRIQNNQESIANQLQSRQADTVIPLQINDEGTVNQLQSSRADTITKIQTNQEGTAIHVQLRQADTIVPTRTNQEGTTNQLQLDTSVHIQSNQVSTAQLQASSRAKSANQIHAMQEYTTSYSQLREADSRNTASQLHSSQEKTPTQVQPGQEYITNHSQLQQSHRHTVNQVQANQERKTNQLKSSKADTVVGIQTTQEYFANHFEPRQSGAALNHMQINQETIQLQLGQADTVKQMQSVQESCTNQLIQALTANKKQTTQEYFTNHPKRSPRDNVNHMQINQGNSAYQLQLNRADSVNQIAMQENTTNRSQLIQGLTVNQIQAIRENNTRYLQPRYAENPIRQSGFAPTPEWGHGAPVTNFWKNVDIQKPSGPARTDAAPVAATSSANVQRQYAPAPEPVLPTQAAMPEAADPSGFGLSLFGNSWSDPCIEFAFKTLTGDIPVLDDQPGVADYFPLQHDLNKIAPPDYSAPSVDDTRNHHSVPRPSDRFYNGGWFPPQ